MTSRALARRALVGVAAAAALLGGGCHRKAPAPTPGKPYGAVPELRGRRVMVLPIQRVEGLPEGATPDAELEHALRFRGPAVLWSFPPEMERALQRSPGVPARLRDLPVGAFLQAEVRRVGDPLYGELRRLAALAGAEVAMLPVELRYGEEGAYRLAAALLDVRSGRVHWFGIVAGAAGDAGAMGTLASAAEALARALLPFQ